MKNENTGELPENEILPSGTILKERYVIEQVAGRGGFAVTYRAWDPVLDCTVAVKEYRKGLERFLEEARVMARFRSCRNLVYVYDFFREGGAAYIVMEFLKGETLKQKLLRAERLETGEAVRIMKEVLTCLTDIHAKGLIHRDVAPDNIYLCEDGSVKLFDFGSARPAGSRSKDVEIKRSFSPPEQYDPEKTVEETSDVYSSAAVFFWMLTGRTPPSAMERIREDKLCFSKKKDRDIPPKLQKLVLQGLALRPEARIPTTQIFLQRILECTEKTHKKKNSGYRRKNRILAAALLVLLPALIMTAGRSYLNREQKKSTAAASVSVSQVETEKETTQTLVIEPVKPEKGKETVETKEMKETKGRAEIAIEAETAKETKKTEEPETVEPETVEETTGTVETKEMSERQSTKAANKMKAVEKEAVEMEAVKMEEPPTVPELGG